MPITGSLNTFTYNKQTYKIIAEADVDQQNKFLIEDQATSGDPFFKMTKQTEKGSGFIIQADKAQRKKFKLDANDGTPHGCTWVTADGTSYTADCMINITADTTYESKITFDATPTKAAGWQETIV